MLVPVFIKKKKTGSNGSFVFYYYNFLNKSVKIWKCKKVTEDIRAL